MKVHITFHFEISFTCVTFLYDYYLLCYEVVFGVTFYSYILFVALVEVAKYKILDSRIKCLDVRQEGMVDTLQG